MIASWLIYCLLVATLVSAAAWLADRAFRAQDWPLRWAWVGGLAATAGLPIWAWLARSSTPMEAAAPLPGAYVMEALPPLVLSAPSSSAVSLEALALGSWAVASGLLLLWLAVSALRLNRARRRWRRDELHGMPVLVSERTGPAAMGLIRGMVVLPTWALELDERRRSLMVLHEAEHVRAGDPRLAVAGLVLCALMPWNLPAWWQLRRLRLAIEMDCDARVLRRSGDLRGYGSLLLDVGRRQPRLALGLSETRSSLERRIRMITKRTGRRTGRAVMVAAVAGAVLAVACETPAPVETTEPEAREVDPIDVEMGAGAGSLSADEVRLRLGEGECTPTVYLDGQETSWAEIGSPLHADRVAVVEVVKGAAAEQLGEDACGVVRITSKEAAGDARESAGVSPESTSEVREPGLMPPSASSEIAAQPRFTPFTERPELRSPADVQKQLQTQYPSLLRDAGIGGTASVWFFIDAEGRVQETRIHRGTGHDALDEAALRVADTMEFTPALNHGEPVPVWVALNITFEVE